MILMLLNLGSLGRHLLEIVCVAHEAAKIDTVVRCSILRIDQEGRFWTFAPAPDPSTLERKKTTQAAEAFTEQDP